MSKCSLQVFITSGHIKTHQSFKNDDSLWWFIDEQASNRQVGNGGIDPFWFNPSLHWLFFSRYLLVRDLGIFCRGQGSTTDAMPFVVVFLFLFIFLTSLSRHIRTPFGSEPGIRTKSCRRVGIRGGNVAALWRQRSKEQRGRLSEIIV